MASPVNLPAILAKKAEEMATERLAEQVESEEDFMADCERGFNPAASIEMQERLNRFRPLQQRKRVLETKEEQLLEEVDLKTEEELSFEFQQRNPELPANKLSALRRMITERDSVEEILNKVNSQFDDPTLADEALEFLTKTTTGALRDAVNRARALHNVEKRREIVAGRNISSVARSFQEKGIADNPTQLRDLYRDITGNPRDHNILFTQLSQKYPFDQLKMVIAFLLQGLAFDLKSKGPSIQEAELIRLMTEIRNLQSILWVYLFFRGKHKFIRSLFKRHGRLLGKNLTFEKLAQNFIKLVEERYPTILKVTQQMREFELDELEQIIVLNQYLEAIRGLSPRVYKTQRHREDLMLILVETLEELEQKVEDNT